QHREVRGGEHDGAPGDLGDGQRPHDDLVIVHQPCPVQEHLRRHGPAWYPRDLIGLTSSQLPQPPQHRDRPFPLAVAPALVPSSSSITITGTTSRTGSGPAPIRALPGGP